MKVELKKYSCVVTKEEGDKRYSYGYALPESTFLYHVKLELIKQGFDVIKIRMCKDGHMVEETQQYIRSRNVIDDKYFCVYNCSYAVYDAGLKFNSLKVGESLCLAKEG